MKAIVDDRTKLVSITGIEFELALSMYQYLQSQPEQRSKIAGHWTMDTQDKTISLEMLTLEQVIMLDVLMGNRLMQLSDLVMALDFALETAVDSSQET